MINDLDQGIASERSPGLDWSGGAEQPPVSHRYEDVPAHGQGDPLQCSGRRCGRPWRRVSGRLLIDVWSGLLGGRCLGCLVAQDHLGAANRALRGRRCKQWSPAYATYAQIANVVVQVALESKARCGSW